MSAIKGTVPAELLSPLLTTPESLRTAFRRRRDEFDYQKIHPADKAKYVEQGWEPHREVKSALWLKKSKSVDRLLEDRIWSLFYRMGYPVLSGGNLRISYLRADGTKGVKQVDVFAKDSETAIVVECKARDVLGRRALQKDIHETENLQRGFSNSIRSHFGTGFNPKIIWIYATSNLIWNEKDIERAVAANIRIVTENELQYFEAFISHIGDAGRYQFLAEFLEGQDVPGLTNIKLPAVKGSFGRHKYYSFAVSARHLLKIAFVNHQALNHPDGRPAYQRMINKARIANIGQFIQNGGFFPTNILVNFVEECKFDLLPNKDKADKNLKFGWLYLPNKYKSAWVIDGQHRLYGFSNIPDKFLDNTLFVLAFEQMDTQTEAELFITINHEQRSVPKSLLVSLQADLKLGSDNPKEAIGALSSSLVRSMNTDNTSPFFRRVSIPGITPTDTQNLTIAEAVKGLVRSGLLGRAIAKKSKVPGYLTGRTDAETIARSRKILNGYFKTIMEANPTRWQLGGAAHICTNPGIRAHCQLIQEVLQHLHSKAVIDPFTASPEKIVEALGLFAEPVSAFLKSATDNQIKERFSKQFGEGGVVRYYYHLCEIVARKHKDFGSEEFKKFKAQAADARVEQAERDIGDLQNSISAFVVETLKKIHGTHELPSGEKAYWDLGIENMEIKQNAYKKQQSAPANKRAPKEAYLDLIDFDKILKQASNWATFEPVLSIPMPDESKSQKKYFLTWLEKLNEVRRLSAHKSPFRRFTEDDLELVSWIKSQLYDRFSAAGFDPTAL